MRSVQRVTMLDDHVGYAAIASFTDSTNLEIAFTVDSLVHAGATSLALDLRNNPGGLLAQGVAVAELFLDRGQKIVSTKGRVPTANAAYKASSAQRWPGSADRDSRERVAPRVRRRSLRARCRTTIARS